MLAHEAGGARVIPVDKVGKDGNAWRDLEGYTATIAAGDTVERVLPPGLALHVLGIDCTGREIQSATGLQSLLLTGTHGSLTYDSLTAISAVTKRRSNVLILEYK